MSTVIAIATKNNGPENGAITFLLGTQLIADSHASNDAMAMAVDIGLPLDITAATIGVWPIIVAAVVAAAADDRTGRETADKARTKSAAAMVMMLCVSGTGKADDCQRCHCRYA